MPITRRKAIQTLAVAGATAVLPRPASAREPKRPAPDAVAILYDPTRCIGCKECVRACAETNGRDPEAATASGAQLTPAALTVLRRYEAGGTKTFRKLQCMHCVDPGCVSACMLGAMQKNADGAVTWNGDLCVGCRYCEIACPFNVPRFEWDTPLPSLTKCQLCPERRAEGKDPACVAGCRMGALTYGRREELLAEARRRIAEAPEKYNPKIYGEKDAGGTSVLYLAEAGVSFADMGLPELGEESVPALPETLQHTIYKGMAAPLTLLGLFGIVVRRNSARLHAAEAAEAHHHGRAEPVGGKLLTWPFLLLGLLVLAGVAAIGWRFVVGLGPTTNMSDGYPFGLWIAFDVVTGTALACGGYAMALLVYLLNRGHYHPLVRPAIVTSALGYTLGGMSVLIDLGRAWNFWKIPTYAGQWNLNSILLEVALCIMAYTTVLWIEVSPAFLERWQESPRQWLRTLSRRALPGLERALPYLIAVGMVLPTMHQSSLGSLMLLGGAKLDPLWRTPLLPLLFLVSVVGMGYAAVTLECCISARVFRRPPETPMLRRLSRPVALVLLAYVALRAWDVTSRGQLPRVLGLEDGYAQLFLLEMALFTLPALAVLAWRKRGGPVFFSLMAVAIILAGALYRFSTFLIAFNPGAEWSYFPSLGEFAVTIGLVAGELMGYIYLVKRFPILRGAPREEHPAELPPRGPAPEPQPEERPYPELEAEELEPALAGAGTAGGEGWKGGAARLGALVLLALLAGATLLEAQTPAKARRDLRCLTGRQEHCLPQPLSLSEPHEAVCATCHDLSEQRTLAEAAQSCASGGCHERADTLTPFHRGLPAQVQRNCIGCHAPHDARIASQGKDCTVCHAGGGRPGAREGVKPRAVRRAGTARTVAVSLGFQHAEHEGVKCTSCHATTQRHGAVKVTQAQQCQSCHHGKTVAATCQNCHSQKDTPQGTLLVKRTLNLKLGSLDRPRRSLPFDHARHDAYGCQTCHTGGTVRGPAQVACTSCHEQHHRPEAECTACHTPPATGAHTRQAHLGCGGAGCHEGAAKAVRSVPRTRSFCLVCHEGMVDHQQGGNCGDCHKLPHPQQAQPIAAARR